MCSCTYNLIILIRTLYTLYLDSTTQTIEITPQILKCACLFQSPQLSRLPLFSNMGWKKWAKTSLPLLPLENGFPAVDVAIKLATFISQSAVSKQRGKIKIHLHIFSIRHNFVKRRWLCKTIEYVWGTEYVMLD